MKVLQTAQLNWVQGQDDDNWVVRSDTGDELFQMPGSLKDKEVMAILRAARKYELAAYEAGKQNGLDAMQIVTHDKMVQLELTNSRLRFQNERLAGILETTIGGSLEDFDPFDPAGLDT